MKEPDIAKEQLINDLIKLRQRVNELERVEADKQTYEKELAAAKAMFEGLFEFAPDAIVVVSRGGRIVQANKQAERLFGYAREELLAMEHDVLLPDRFRDKHQSHRAKYMSGPRTRPMGTGLELYGRKRDGSEFPVDIALGPLQSGKEVVVLAVVRDFTERKLAEEKRERLLHELTRSNKELEQFAYAASHDLQEPLRMVAGYIQMLEHKYKDRLDATAGEFIRFAVEGAAQMQKLIEGLLTYSRITSKGDAFSSVDVTTVFDAAIANLAAAIREGDATITRDDLPTVPGDRMQLTQLFQNLIGNAIKFRKTEVRPQVHVSARKEAGAWIFSIRDNGIGMDPAHLDRIFLVFQRLHTHEEYPGSGIGLSLCKRIVERHHGRIWAESAPGAGSTFFFTLPHDHPDAGTGKAP